MTGKAEVLGPTAPQLSLQVEICLPSRLKLQTGSRWKTAIFSLVVNKRKFSATATDLQVFKMRLHGLLTT